MEQARIQVAVRVRPVLPHEACEEIAVSCTQDGARVQVTLPERETSKPAIAANSRPDAKAYEFDACLNGSTTQAQLFDVCGMDELVEAAIDGYNVTVFAFGQTGSGKSHTIIGSCRPSSSQPAAAPAGVSASPSRGSSAASGAAAAAGASALGEEEGLLARCVSHLYRCIVSRSREVECSVTASCCEVYQEAVTDLLAQNKTQQLQVRQDKSDGFYVEGLTHTAAADERGAMALMSRALTCRHTRSHKLNAHSSRSHCLMSFAVASQQLGEAQQGAKGGVRRAGKLVLVDLAGSERLRGTGNSGKEAVRETGAINKSLFTLGQVLAALSVRGGCGVTGHVPYRDSRLTQLLWDSLKGGGRTLMLACLCPLKAAADESLNTLHFASMALRIKSEPVVIMDPQDQVVLEMRDTIRALQEDCRSLAGALSQMTRGADVASVLDALPPTLLQDALRCGSSSAPTEQQGSRASGSGRCARSRGVLGSSMQQLRNSGSSGDGLARPKGSGLLNKPGSAGDARVRHSLPSPPCVSRSSSPCRRSTTKQLRQQQQQQQQPAWNMSPSLLGPGTNRNSWPAFLTQPPGSVSSSPMQAHHAGAPLAAAATGWFGSLRGQQQQQQQAAWAASGPGSSLASPWTVHRSDCSAGVAGKNATAGHDVAAYGSGQEASDSHAAAHRPVAASTGHQLAAAGYFPELAALEQQFQLMMAQQQQQGHAQPPQLRAAAAAADGAADTGKGGAAAAGLSTVPFKGADGLLLQSNLTASILSPRTLVPVRLSVADTETIGTRPDVSPVTLALAAADSHVRPIAVPLPPGLPLGGGAQLAAGRAAAASGAGAGAGAPAAAAVIAEPKALSWAQRNLWFGADPELTSCAYQVHDVLCAAEGLDPASDAYYSAIESRVAQALPAKWEQWQRLMLAVQQQATAGPANSTSSVCQGRQSTSPVGGRNSYPSYRVALREPVPRFTSCSPLAALKSRSSAADSHEQQRQQQQPFLAGGHVPHQQQQQQQHLSVPASSSVVRQQRQPHEHLWQQTPSAFSPQMLQQYQLLASTLAASGVEPARMAQAPAAAADLPKLQQSESPVPPPDAELSTAPAAAAGANRQHAGIKAFGAPGTGMYSTLLSPADCSTANWHVDSSQPMNSCHQSQQQPVSLSTGESAAKFGVAATALNEALTSSVPSLYSGAGPLTAGAGRDWTGVSNSGSGVQAGKDLAKVLRSGYSPGNKSLAEIQADYRAARGLLMDQLKRQKEAAELQRKQILLQIGRAINSNKWH